MCLRIIIGTRPVCPSCTLAAFIELDKRPRLQKSKSGRFGNKCVRQLLLGFAHPVVLLRSEEFRVAVKRSFGLLLAVLKAHVGERIRIHENMPRLVAGQYGHAQQSVTEATGDAKRTLHDALLAALAHIFQIFTSRPRPFDISKFKF